MSESNKNVPPHVIVEVFRGCVDITFGGRFPPGMRVVVRDYDTTAFDEEREISKDDIECRGNTRLYNQDVYYPDNGEEDENDGE
jgi:hypothetical protein